MEKLTYSLHETQHIIKIINIYCWKLTQFGLILHILIVLKYIAEIKLLLVTLETHAHCGDNVQKVAEQEVSVKFSASALSSPPVLH